jgi:hypothetical protein
MPLPEVSLMIAGFAQMRLSHHGDLVHSAKKQNGNSSAFAPLNKYLS